jgi:predicted Zn finger-like uncharacterized protein
MTPMVVQCSSCLTEFELDPGKVPAAGVRARCSVCSAVINVPAPSAVTPEHHAHTQAAPPHAEPLHPEPAQVAAPETPAAEPAGSATAVAKEPESPAPVERPREPVAAEPSYAAPAPAPSAATATAWSLPKPSVPPAVSPVEADAGQRRPINPFLTRDPALRAKRLARALVSDIVAYHPARHAEGLRDGTLKTLFRDEIKKSYEEYVDQVGRDFAGSTTHFQDALNDVLASGKKLF